ncbi:hypothetical protein LR48_Vigan08g101500 [Vigna angularis]|uniref:Uncharacterized protein n=1 Tax=Phaseolus angularis TaxID=3914 RepID=A0A0L9V5E7_PHAAN|nr:hypothetical protein LR48_Vigan08g101500 [Vigna angularis]
MLLSACPIHYKKIASYPQIIIYGLDRLLLHCTLFSAVSPPRRQRASSSVKPELHLTARDLCGFRFDLSNTNPSCKGSSVCFCLTFIFKCDLEVVVYEGVIREKATSKEHCPQFLKDYSGRHAATVGSVLVSNLKTGFRKGDSDRV